MSYFREIDRYRKEHLHDSNFGQILNRSKRPIEAKKGIAEMGVDWHEPVFRQGFENSPEFNATKALLQEFCWVEFLGKFEGFNDQVSLDFSRGLKDHRV